ncbi:hypothetical protein HSR122_2482 [Halapricum desulfuricans]|uniref:Uncharacterized protein n=1 Tax=Halapricum desulfuricans TaxID=2841257 RepID=A0A897NBN8_9EURY|nr:hypothetical protein HSR122_2482 [Halapricum desulfuricans]
MGVLTAGRTKHFTHWTTPVIPDLGHLDTVGCAFVEIFGEPRVRRTDGD